VSRARIGAIAAGLAVAAVSVALLPGGLVGVVHDDGTYLALARSLAEGTGFRLAFLPGAPPAHVAPLYPVFLAALWALWPAFPDNLALLRAANPVLLGLFAGGFAGYLTWRRVLPAVAASVAAAVFATAIPVLAQTTVLLADPLVLVLMLGAWVFADASVEAGPGRRASGLAAGAGVVAGLAALTRASGVGSLVAVVLVLAVRRRRREALLAAACSCLVLLPWLTWSALHREIDPLLAAAYGGYGALLRQAGVHVLSLEALWEGLRPLGMLAFATLRESYHPYAGVPAVLVLVAGGVALIRRAPAMGWSLAGCLGVLVSWPYASDRLVWVLVPALGVALVVGGVTLWRGAAVGGIARRLALRGLVLAGVLPAVAGFVPFQVEGLLRGAVTAGQRSTSATFETVVPWVRTGTPSSAVIAGEHEALVWLYTRRRTAPSNLWHLVGRSAVTFGPDSLRTYFGRAGVTHLLVTEPRSEVASVLDDAWRLFPGFLVPVRVWPGGVAAFAVFPAAGPPAPPPSPAAPAWRAPDGGTGHPPGLR
jgi:hypothetical protein